ncbi:MAG TPA: sulfatase-like hydrolase/transferase, partial [Sphingomonadaceae bacterium]|nr:sulfatase-like hydrolase/transferase [Sphingomonadaceae bacterium]
LMWIIGAPPRHAEIVLGGAIGLIVRHHLRWLQFLAFIGLLAYSILSFVAGLFNLSLSSLLASLKFFLELDPSQSIEYMYGAAALLVLAGGAWFALRRRSGFSDNRLLVLAVIAVLGVASLDIWMGTGMRGHYKREAVAGAPFTSAMEQSDLVSGAAPAQRNLMVIMVESLGVPVANEEMSRLLFARYRDPAVTDRFELSTGETTYYNSTTAGEIRELCGRWGDYHDLLDRTDTGCLPAQLRTQGYDSIAYHSFTGDFFERETWYPNIGFDEQVFADRLVEQGTRICGGVFPGACDRDVPKLLAERLKSAEKPQFVYWLTVNSHLPVPPSYNLDVDHCETVSPKLAAELPMICRQFAIWDAVDQALVREITAADFPPTDILIVGDHMPPYFDRHHRKQFAPDRVPWLMLRWRGGEGTSPDLVHGATGQPVRADQG